MITAAQLVKISQIKPPSGNVASLTEAMEMLHTGVEQPHRTAHFLAQIMHESGGLKWNKEIWGPTAAQSKYEGRKDLGNTQKGDGSKFRGYGMGQITGRGNTTRFWKWCVKNSLNPPDFTKYPEKMATDVWSGLSALWYWDEGNPSGKSLNVFADRNDIEMITKLWNGGLNGYEDRINYYVRAALVLLGYGVKEIKKFQVDKNLKPTDNIAGPKTRAAMHKALVALTLPAEQSSKISSAPVVEQQAVAVTPAALDAPWYKSKEVLGPVLGGGALTGASTFMEKFGGIPLENLITLMVFGVVCLVGFLLWRKHEDREAVRAEVKAVNA